MKSFNCVPISEFWRCGLVVICSLFGSSVVVGQQVPHSRRVAARSTAVPIAADSAGARVVRNSFHSARAGKRDIVPAIRVDTIIDPQSESDAEFVSYSYAPGVLGVDEPIEIHKGSETVIPHTGWRGMLAMGTYTDGTQSDCAVANPCTRIDWPAMNVTTDGAGYNRAEPSTWYGSIASTGTEGSGLQYMRNRYYDPKRGQFTQADPIGLAGGLNLYGFADGDPMNFGDPFGLRVCFAGNAGARQLLSREFMNATHTSFELDKDGCTSNASPTDKEPDMIAVGFGELASSQLQFTFGLGPSKEIVGTGPRSGYDHTTGRIMINPGDVGRIYGTAWNGQNRTCMSTAGARYTMDVIIVHELGHAYDALSTPLQNQAMAWENLRHIQKGQPLRPNECHIPER